jgi:hypothetical protein
VSLPTHSAQVCMKEGAQLRGWLFGPHSPAGGERCGETSGWQCRVDAVVLRQYSKGMQHACMNMAYAAWWAEPGGCMCPQLCLVVLVSRSCWERMTEHHSPAAGFTRLNRSLNEGDFSCPSPASRHVALPCGCKLRVVAPVLGVAYAGVFVLSPFECICRVKLVGAGQANVATPCHSSIQSDHCLLYQPGSKQLKITWYANPSRKARQKCLRYRVEILPAFSIAAVVFETVRCCCRLASKSIKQRQP